MDGPTCPNGHDVDQEFAFCPRCGSELAVARCRNGHPVDPSFSFCPTCGAPTLPEYAKGLNGSSSGDLRCPAGHSYQAGDSFCPQCALPLWPQTGGVGTYVAPTAQLPNVSETRPTLSTSPTPLPAVYPTTANASPSPSNQRFAASRPVTPAPVPQSAVVKDKSVGAALVLTFLFGPLGLFYVGALPGLIGLFVLIPVGVIGGFITFGVIGVIVWFVSMVWGAVAASNKHSRYQAWLVAQHGQAMRGWPT